MDNDSKLLSEQYTKVTESITGYRNVRLSDGQLKSLGMCVNCAVANKWISHMAADDLHQTLDKA